MVTIDVVALCPSISHDEVPQSLKAMLREHKEDSDVIPDICLLEKIILHILQNNVFEFDGRVYQQIQGTAMGTCMAPSIANIFMGWLEKRLLASSPWKIQAQH